ncbi:MAG: cation:dicarboxylase symporter family transporter [Saprospiraceae bacterium]|nr:cation:dicarboxylase symporter family transporter [Saprospiraceae bacterium]
MKFNQLFKSLTFWIFFSLVAGVLVGMFFPEFAQQMDVLSKIFLKLIKTIIAPLLFSTLVIGIAGHADIKQVGRMGWKSILYFELVTTVALLFGLLAANIIRPGDGIDLSSVEVEQTITATKQDWKEIILHTFPENIAKSIAEGQVLQIVVFSILFAIGLTMVPNEHHRRTMLDWTESLAEVMFKFTKVVMYLAPFGVFGAMAFAVGKMGLDIFGPIIKLILTLYGALILFILLVLLPIALFMRIKISKFLRAISEPITIAFGTASSEAALAPAMESLEKYGVPRKFVSFVLPTGMSFNLDGTTLYLAAASIFVAQANGVEMSVGEQIVMMLTLMLTSKGVAGVARASLVILLGTVAMFGLSDAPIYIILAVDVVMDMARTSVNMLGNCLATVVVAKWEGEFEEA